MIPRLIALTVCCVVGFSAAVGTSGAQEARPSTGVTSTGATTTTAPTPTSPPADMTLAEFIPLRVGYRADTNRIRERKCRGAVHPFRIGHREVKPWRRSENLEYWRGQREEARNMKAQCLTRLVKGTPAQAIRLGRIMAAKKGWVGEQWSCLRRLWGPYESSWRWWADNPNSAAYGIPQALPGSKMTPGSNDWVTHTWKQIRWGLGYIKGRYGTPCAALAFRIANHWY